MCCFSRPVESVTKTRIFARNMMAGRQLIAYSMTLDSRVDVAMILPIPVAARAGERAVRFINLSGYPEFFADLYKGCIVRSRGATKGMMGRSQGMLEVVDIGNFVASYVPTPADFARLNPAFRLPQNAWNKLPQYGKYGFAVFQLKSGK